MRNGQMQGGSAGIILAVITGSIQPVLLAFLPTAVVQSIWMPVLAVRYGNMCAILSEMAALGCAGAIWGYEAAGILALLTVIPGGLGIWLSGQKMELGRKIQWLFAAQATGFMLALALLRLICGMEVADFLADKLANLMAGDGGGVILYGASLLGWISADTMIRIGEYGGTAAQMAARISEDMRMLLPAGVFGASALTALAAAWWPMHTLARQGMAEKGQYVPMEKWWIPLPYMLCAGISTLCFVLLYAWGVDGARALGQTSFALLSLALTVQGAAALYGRMKKQAVRRRIRVIWMAALVLLTPGILEMIGLWISLIGPRGLIHTWMKRIQKNDDDHEGRD